MSESLERWAVPPEFTVSRAEHVLPQTRMPRFPELDLLAYVAVEKRLSRRAKPANAADAIIDLAAWQLTAGAPEVMLRTVLGALSNPVTPAHRLGCARLLRVAPGEASSHVLGTHLALRTSVTAPGSSGWRSRSRWPGSSLPIGRRRASRC